MLVLSRKLDESIKIGNDIKITILRVKGNTIRIGIDAPSDVRVIRSELKAHVEIANLPVELQESTETQGDGQEELAATVTAIVDSPTVSSTRLFVGKVSRPNPRGPLQPAALKENVAAAGGRESSQGQDERKAPLRAFRRSGHGLTAV